MLSTVKLVGGPIVPSNFLVPMVGIVPVILTILASIAAPFYFVDTMWSLGEQAAALSAAKPAATATTAVDSHGTPLTAILIPIAILITLPMLYIAVTSVIVALLKIVAHAIGWPLSKVINGVVWSSIRQQAWGDDRAAESVGQIGAHPPGFAPKFLALPPAIADTLSKYSEKNAVLTLSKVREVLGMKPGAKPSADVRSQLAEQLNWAELIHTTYFDIPEFVDLAALGLHKAGLADYHDEVRATATRDEVQQWYEAIAVKSG